MTRMVVTAEQRILLFLCDTDTCEHEGVWLCPQGRIACDTHKDTK